MSKKPAILAFASIIILSLCQQLFAGEINGQTYTSSVYKGLQLTVPAGWNIEDAENTPAQGLWHTVIRLKHTRTFNGKRPNGYLQTASVPNVSVSALASSMADSFRQQGFDVGRQVSIMVDGKQAQELRYAVTKQGVTLEGRMFIMGGIKYIYILNLLGTKPSVIGQDVHKMVKSLRYM